MRGDGRVRRPATWKGVRGRLGHERRGATVVDGEEAPMVGFGGEEEGAVREGIGVRGASGRKGTTGRGREKAKKGKGKKKEKGRDLKKNKKDLSARWKDLKTKKKKKGRVAARGRG